MKPPNRVGGTTTAISRDARRLRRDDRHQQARRIRRGPAGDADAHPPQRPIQQTQLDPRPALPAGRRGGGSPADTPGCCRGPGRSSPGRPDRPDGGRRPARRGRPGSGRARARRRRAAARSRARRRGRARPRRRRSARRPARGSSGSPNAAIVRARPSGLTTFPRGLSSARSAAIARSASSLAQSIRRIRKVTATPYPSLAPVRRHAWPVNVYQYRPRWIRRNAEARRDSDQDLAATAGRDSLGHSPARRPGLGCRGRQSGRESRRTKRKTRILGDQTCRPTIRRR